VQEFEQAADLLYEALMMTRIRTRIRGEGGFTLIELLVVIFIIGVLAAIALPIFIGQKAKATDANAKALARTGFAAMETYAVANGNYAATTAELIDIAPELNDASAWALTSAPNGFKVSVTSNGGRDFDIERLPDSSVERTCAPVGGGCPTSGIW
jgi:type IV pilus assembly protein PilA